MRNQATRARAAALALCLCVAAFLAGPAYGQQTGYSIAVHATPLSCSTAAGTSSFAIGSWAFGAQTSVGLTRSGAGGRSTGASALSPLEVVKTFDECSPDLFGAAAAGKHLDMVNLVVSKDNVKLLAVQVSEVIVTSYQLGSAASNAPATETVAFSYGKITITNYTKGAGSVCWDATAGRFCQ